MTKAEEKQIQKLLADSLKGALENWDNVINEFNTIKKANNLISYKALMNQLNFLYPTRDYEELIENIFEQAKKAWKEDKDIIFRSFVLSKERNERYSLLFLVPTLKKESQANVPAFSLVNSSDPVVQKILDSINEIIEKHITSSPIEIFSNLIIYRLPESKLIKVTFGKEYLTNEY
ncbi:MSC_0623 family F1-like ATPase-associated protein [Mycoplasma struthionis]|uniref:DUF2714 domain-containing protein n=1 Tax=Mycoplasma struthionis TaxID=538220 RepID=A0A502M200_9MOLU|nr:DUF2714 domain-containing protein [Mycoplasma struthionis]TPI02279.1 DUF2714 domain-containing protein [Mycoplasma struthionis]